MQNLNKFSWTCLGSFIRRFPGLHGTPTTLALREKLRSGEISLTDFHGQLLRVVYRLIFLFVAENRTIERLSLLHPRDGSETARLARERYAARYGFLSQLKNPGYRGATPMPSTVFSAPYRCTETLTAHHMSN